MAVLEKKFDKDKWKDLLIQKQKEDKIAKDAVNAHEAAKKVAGNPISSPFSENWRYDDGTDNPEDFRGKPVFGTEEDGQTFFEFPFVKIRGNNQKVAHHLKDHFQDIPPQEILRRHMTGEQPLSPEDLERIFGPDYEKLLQQQQQKQSLKIGTA